MANSRTIDGRKYVTEHQTPAPFETIYSYNRKHTVGNSSKTSVFKNITGPQVEMKLKKTLGKNPPPKLPTNRPKAMPSIPSNTVAPPEDKTMTMTTLPDTKRDLIRETENQSGFSRPLGTRKVEYLKSIEKANNPNVGPGSYDPSKPKMQATSNTDWSLGPERFKYEKIDRGDSMYILSQNSPQNYQRQ